MKKLPLWHRDFLLPEGAQFFQGNLESLPFGEMESFSGTFHSRFICVLGGCNACGVPYLAGS